MLPTNHQLNREKARFIEWAGILLIILIGLIHFAEAPEEWAEAPYMGVLFYLNFSAALAAAVGLRRRAAWGWLLGLLIAAGSIAGYVLSRTVGLPEMHLEPWLQPAGILSLAAEGAFILLAILRWPRLKPLSGPNFSLSPGLHAIVPGALLVATAALALGIAFWSTRTVVVSAEQIEESYGVQVSLVATSMLGSIVDLRLKIVDPKKARELLEDHDDMPWMIVQDGGLSLLPPPNHRHQAEVLAGRTYAYFYPNPGLVVRPGSVVSVVFGHDELAGITVR